MGSARWMMLSAGAIATLYAAPAAAQWRPSKPIEFVATAGPGGGTQKMGRARPGILKKKKVTGQPVGWGNKSGGRGGEGDNYGKGMAREPPPVDFRTGATSERPH